MGGRKNRDSEFIPLSAPREFPSPRTPLSQSSYAFHAHCPSRTYRHLVVSMLDYCLRIVVSMLPGCLRSLALLPSTERRTTALRCVGQGSEIPSSSSGTAGVRPASGRRVCGSRGHSASRRIHAERRYRVPPGPVTNRHRVPYSRIRRTNGRIPGFPRATHAESQ